MNLKPPIFFKVITFFYCSKRLVKCAFFGIIRGSYRLAPVLLMLKFSYRETQDHLYSADCGLTHPLHLSQPFTDSLEICWLSLILESICRLHLEQNAKFNQPTHHNATDAVAESVAAQSLSSNRKHLRRLPPIRHKTQIISGSIKKKLFNYF